MKIERFQVRKRSAWNTLFTSGISEENPHLYTRLLFMNAIMYVVGLVVLFFVMFHFGYTENYILGGFDAFVLALIIFLNIHLRIRKSIKLIGHLSAVGMIFFYVVFIPVTQNEHMSFVWVFFAPLFIILLNGWKVGLVYLLILYSIIFPMAYMNIGVWDNGDWSSTSAYRFIIGLILGALVAILIDVTQNLSNQRQQRSHEKEVLYLDELKRLSMTDGLTGLYNRHYFNRVFKDKIKALSDHEQYLAFFIVDIDFFKAYNDSYGHQAGDLAIQKIATVIREYVQRENDVVFRLGGEEFGGLIETRKPQETVEWLSLLVEEVSHLNILHAPNVDLPCLTISGGVSYMKVTHDTDMNTLYKRADDALYQAKHNGRNQFVVYGEKSKS
ncbi:GGDEF domain-containing protein [Thiomicrorhabdus lithotrophica]|uniref:diguanylate cyclase n=1 Tax=Thiomicrorhabdus lithotrophica TaxID=2949997 RepID=A0ABY8C903_9GAMM|nr:GGDEF domain-containing protein [Thiomicrorhabdus lithotrophica]WEJ62454.1 GGDEF domain-containing protein [Thiomicrorhabdus lithotrophica]